MATLLGSMALTALSTEVAIQASNVAGSISAEVPFIDIANTATVTVTGAGGFDQRFVFLRAPVMSAATPITIPNAATLYIAGAPSGGGAGPLTITDAYALWIDAGAARFDGNVGIGGTAIAQLQVFGTSAGGACAISQSATSAVALNITQNTNDIGLSITNAGIGITFKALRSATSTDAEVILADLDASATLTVATTYGDQRFVVLRAPAMSIAEFQTVTNAATLYIAGAPSNGGAGTLTNAYALWVDAGNSRFDGRVTINAGASGAIISGAADDLVLDGTAFTGMSILSSPTGFGGIYFSDSGSATAGVIQYDHTNDELELWAGTALQLNLSSTRAKFTAKVGIGTEPTQDLHVVSTNASGACAITQSTNAAAVIAVTQNTASPAIDILGSGAFIQMIEVTAPAAGAANTGRLFLQDNGFGKTQLMIQFATGAAQQITIEP